MLIKLEGKRKRNSAAPIAVIAALSVAVISVVTIVVIVIVSVRQNIQILTNPVPIILNITV